MVEWSVFCLLSGKPSSTCEEFWVPCLRAVLSSQTGVCYCGRVQQKKEKTTLLLTPDHSEHQQGFWEWLKQRGRRSQPWATDPGFFLTDWRPLDGGSPSCYGNPDDWCRVKCSSGRFGSLTGSSAAFVVSNHQMQLKRWCFFCPASTTQHSRRRYAAAPEKKTKHSWQLKQVAGDVNPSGSALFVGCTNPSEHLRDISPSGRGCWENKLLSVLSQRQRQSCLQGCVLVNAVVLEKKKQWQEIKESIKWSWTGCLHIFGPELTPPKTGWSTQPWAGKHGSSTPKTEEECVFLVSCVQVGAVLSVASWLLTVCSHKDSCSLMFYTKPGVKVLQGNSWWRHDGHQELLNQILHFFISFSVSFRLYNCELQDVLQKLSCYCVSRKKHVFKLTTKVSYENLCLWRRCWRKLELL